MSEHQEIRKQLLNQVLPDILRANPDICEVIGYGSTFNKTQASHFGSDIDVVAAIPDSYLGEWGNKVNCWRTRRQIEKNLKKAGYQVGQGYVGVDMYEEEPPIQFDIQVLTVNELTPDENGFYGFELAYMVREFGQKVYPSEDELNPENF
jgi:hypothetical protein